MEVVWNTRISVEHTPLNATMPCLFKYGRNFPYKIFPASKIFLVLLIPFVSVAWITPVSFSILSSPTYRVSGANSSVFFFDTSSIPPSRTHFHPSGSRYGHSSSGTSAAARRSSGVSSCFFLAMLSSPLPRAVRWRLLAGAARLLGGLRWRSQRSRLGRVGLRSR